MERFDVVVMGLDPALARDVVVAAVAKHLEVTPARIEELLSAAPTALVADVTELDARRLVTDLRQLGARVKPRAASAAPSTSPPAEEPSRARRPPPPSEIELSSLGPAEGSGLELDLPLPEPRAPSLAPRASHHSSRAPAIELTPEPHRARGPSAAPPRVIEPREEEERPRAFWTALPEAFLVPFRGHAIYGLLGAPVLAVTAMLAVGVGMRLSMMAAVFALVLVFGFVGTMLQVSRRCLWAASVGERTPDPLSTDFMSEYMFTGAGVVVAQVVLGGISGWIGLQLLSRGAPELVVDGLGVFVGLYGVIGFALSAANGSASGYLDVARILRILVKAPLHVLTIALLGALVQGGAILVASLQLVAAAATGELGTIFVSLGVVGFVVSFAATYGAALTATMMGMLFYAKPEVAN